MPNSPSPALSRLEQFGKHFDGFQKSGKGWVAHCPAHDDSTPSLSIDPGDDGRILLRCRAGCPTEAVVEAVGLKMSDLMPDAPKGDRRVPMKLITSYVYRDEEGRNLRCVDRMEGMTADGKREKSFPQYRALPDGGWEAGVKGVRDVLYRLPELLEADPALPVFVVEGEKDADRLRSLGLIATTNAGGAGKNWLPDYSESLRGRSVILIPDNDPPGINRVHAIAEHLLQDEIAATVKILRLPNLPDHGDVSDWLDAGGTPDGLSAMVKEAWPLTWVGLKFEQMKGLDFSHITEFPADPDDGELSSLNSFYSSARPDLPALGEAAYHGFAGEFIRAIAPFTEAPDAGMLAHLLPAIGVIIGPGPRVHGGDEQPCRLNTILVGESSLGRKGTSFVPIRSLIREVDAVFEGGQFTSGLSSGEGLIERVKDKKTQNKDGEEQIEEVDKRLYVVEPEFSKVLAHIGREKNILSQVLRETYDSGNLNVLTKNPVSVRGAHISITGHITPYELDRRFDEVEMANGFGNRFLWFYVESGKMLPDAPPIPSTILKKFAWRLNGILEFAWRQSRLERDEAAREHWLPIYSELRKPQSGLQGAMLARGESIVLRLSLLYALLDRSTSIRIEHIDAAMAVWKYCEESIRLLFGEKSGNTLADRIYEVLSEGFKTSSQLHPRVKANGKQIKAALKELSDRGLIRMRKVKSEGSGRPAEVWERIT